MMWKLSSSSVPSEVKRRKISLLLHSTHLYKNLPQIIADKTLSTAGDLIAKFGHERAHKYLHDLKRYEQLAVGLDYLNCSLTVPNFELLYHRSKTTWKSEWIHLAVDLSLLYKEETLFSPVSAAQEQGKFLRSGIDGLKSLFDPQVEEFSRSDLPDHIPTHPQAEVLVKGSLPIVALQKILVADVQTAQEVERLLSLHDLYIKVEAVPHLFVWPERLLRK
jgi:hypothetical protein